MEIDEAIKITESSAAILKDLLNYARSMFAHGERALFDAGDADALQVVLAELSLLRSENETLTKERDELKAVAIEFRSAWLRKCSNCDGVGCGNCAGEGWVCRVCSEPEGDCECDKFEPGEGGDGGS